MTIVSTDFEKYAEAQRRELLTASEDMIRVAVDNPDVIWDGRSIRESAQSKGVNPAAYGLALMDLIEEGVMLYDRKTHEVGLVAVGHA